MVIEMIDEIKEVKTKNGNANICQKDLLWYAIGKIDKIYDKLDTKVDKRTFYTVTGTLSSLLVILIGAMVFIR